MRGRGGGAAAWPASEEAGAGADCPEEGAAGLAEVAVPDQKCSIALRAIVVSCIALIRRLLTEIAQAEGVVRGASPEHSHQLTLGSAQP